MQRPEDYFTPLAISLLRRLIEENDGQEVFCVGELDQTGRVSTVRIVARGNDRSVPAFLDSASPGMAAIHNHPGGDLTPSGADINLAGEFGAAGVASYIVDNGVTRLHALVEPFKPKDVQELPAGRLQALFQEGGELARLFPGFEVRPQQAGMVETVVQAFNGKQVALIEAGTGVGKSLAYLIPSVEWAIRNKERIVISTNTINLQEQLIHKDIPFIQQGLKYEFTAVLMKGRHNYLCLRRAYDLKAEPSLVETTDQSWELGLLFDWMEKTKDGSLADLSFTPSRDIWDLVSCEADNCGRVRCRHFSRCFFYNARREATRAQLIVTNHHLLMSDLALRSAGQRQSSGVLPAFHKLVLDEAHHLEDVAANYLGVHLSPYHFSRNLNRLQSSRADDKGLIPGLGAILYKLTSSGDHPQIARILKYLEDTFTEARRDCRQRLEAEFRQLAEGWLRLEEHDLRPGEELKRRITPESMKLPFWRQAVQPGLREAAAAAAGFIEVCQHLLNLVYKLETPLLEHLENTLMEIEAVVLRLKAAAAELEQFMEDDENSCRWLEVRRRKDACQIAFRQAPLDVAARLRELLFESYEAMVLTSATLAVGRSFTFIRRRTGLDRLPAGRVLENILESPYDYAGRVMLGIPNDLPDPAASGFAGALGDLILQAVTLTGGNTFVLFTSYALMTAAHRQLESPLLLQGITVLRQGQMNRHQLLEEFRTRGRTVLLAVDSFWEGVDVKGEALQCVIIPKLPFQVPSEPLVEARLEKIRKEGGNPFYDYSIPHAVIKLKQGFGRLIRSHQDWGLVVICDKRVLTKSYGARFLASLPPCQRRVQQQSALLLEMRRFREQFQKT